ncbi:NAP1-related protein 2-like isoform X2 [Henckelia pumila]|uniref:NAP1-related protein 2-like isoform X2 n=1 Tax=Henckelia pumila TaxID=405737 RepID=UPI003C6E3BEE
MGADKGKKQKLGQAEEENNGTDHVDGDLVLSIEKLQEIQDELEKINEEASEKVLEVEQQYNEIRKPVYDKRNDLIKSITDFWLTAFLSHPVLGELLTEEDQKIFKHLSNLEVEDFKDVKSGYSITFNFEPNPYFEDTKLTKTVTFLEEGTTTITATSIKWKEGMGIFNGVAEDKKGNKRSHSEESFFTWFYDTQHKGEMVEIHDEVAEIIKDELWPNPLTYFNNEADEEEFEMDDDDDDDEDKGTDESEEGDEDDGEQDDDDDEAED